MGTGPAEGSWRCERYLRDGSRYPWKAVLVSTWYLQGTLQRYLHGAPWCASSAAQMVTLLLVPEVVTAHSRTVLNAALKGSTCAAGCKARHRVWDHHTACTGNPPYLDPSGNKFGFCSLDWNTEMENYGKGKESTPLPSPKQTTLEYFRRTQIPDSDLK